MQFFVLLLHLLVNYVKNATFSFHKIQNTRYLWNSRILVFHLFTFKNQWSKGSRSNIVFLYHFLVILAFLKYFLVRNVCNDNTERETESKTENLIFQKCERLCDSVNTDLIFTSKTHVAGTRWVQKETLVRLQWRPS